MRICLFDRGRHKGPARFAIDINLNLNVRLSDETGLGRQLGILKAEIDQSTDKLEDAVDSAAETASQEKGGY